MLLGVGVSLGGAGIVLMLGDEMMPFESIVWLDAFGGSTTAEGLLCLHPMINRCC